MANALNPTVTGRQSLTVLPYQIATTAGPRRVKGWVFGDFGLHRDRQHHGVALDHLPTGRLVERYDSVTAALRAMAEMSRPARPPIRDEIRHAAEHHQPVTLTAEEVGELDAEIETAVSANEERWAKKETEE